MNKIKDAAIAFIGALIGAYVFGVGVVVGAGVANPALGKLIVDSDE